MAKPSFVVHVADLEHGPRTMSWIIPTGWLKQALEGTEATPVRDGEVTLELSLNGREVVVRGRARVDVVMPCARTLDPVDITMTPEIFLMLAPAAASASARPKLAPRGKRNPRSRRGSGAPEPGRPASGGLSGWSVDPSLADEEVARDTYAGEGVVLDGFLREFILLELPMFPLRSDLRLTEDAGIGGALLGPAAPVGRPLDSRLAPLADIASRMHKGKE
jgi:uncharacterized protein